MVVSARASRAAYSNVAPRSSAGRNEEMNRVAVADFGRVGPAVSALLLDVTQEAQCRAAVQEVVRRHSRLDILVNNAGIGAPWSGPTGRHAARYLALSDGHQPNVRFHAEPARLSGNEEGWRRQDHQHPLDGVVHGRSALDSLRPGQGWHCATQQELRLGVGQGQHSGQHHLAWPDRYGNDQADAGQGQSPHRRRPAPDRASVGSRPPQASRCNWRPEMLLTCPGWRRCRSAPVNSSG